MGDADAFLRAVCATPADDTVRLVYADYLDEQGDSARAEFIRVQVEWARLHAAALAGTILCESVDLTLSSRDYPDTGHQISAMVRGFVDYEFRAVVRDASADISLGVPLRFSVPDPTRGYVAVFEDVVIHDRHTQLFGDGSVSLECVGRCGRRGESHNERLSELRAREQDLLNELRQPKEGDRYGVLNSRAWFGDTLHGVVCRDFAPEFRRGFVEHVTCTSEDWLEHGDAIVAAHPIERVTITTTGALATAPVGDKWSGITFTLPPVPEVVPDGSGGLYMPYFVTPPL